MNKNLEPNWPPMPFGFKPAFTPSRMLKLGVFGGAYFDKARPCDFDDMTVLTTKLARQQRGPFDPRANCFNVKAGLSYADWDERGWIFPEDPLGWFHWYCRFYNGRRHPRDRHQIRRHEKYRERWSFRARNQLHKSGRISPVIMQGLLQWSCDPFGHL